MATVLIVDDHPWNRQLLVTLLGGIGHRVLEAADGSEALDLVRASRPDLVIADVLLPTMDGYELVRQIRNDSRIAATPVVFYTAVYHEHEAQKLAESCGVRHVIAKPSEPETILNIVQAALNVKPHPPPAMGPEDFDRDHLRLLTDKLSQKANELEFANLRLQALVEAGRSLAAQRDPAGLMERLGAAAREIVGARHCVAGMVAEARRGFQCVRTSGFDSESDASPDALPFDRGVVARLFAWESPLRFPDLGADPFAENLPPSHGPTRSFLGISIASVTARYGVLCLTEKLGAEEFSEEDARVAEALAAQAAIVCENIRQDEDLRRSATQLSALAANLRTAREEERARLAREVHEQVSNNLAALMMELTQHTRGITAGAGPQELLRHAARMAELVDRTIEAASKISAELRPAMLNLGIVAAVGWQAKEFQASSGIRCTVEAPEKIALDAERSVEVFRIIQEVLANAARHSGANVVHISMTEDDDDPGYCVIEVRDNGMGILPQEIDDRNSLGLLGMRERARNMGGAIEFRGDVGQGTTVMLRFPTRLAQGVSGPPVNPPPRA